MLTCTQWRSNIILRIENIELVINKVRVSRFIVIDNFSFDNTLLLIKAIDGL